MTIRIRREAESGKNEILVIRRGGEKKTGEERRK